MPERLATLSPRLTVAFAPAPIKGIGFGLEPVFASLRMIRLLLLTVCCAVTAATLLAPEIEFPLAGLSFGSTELVGMESGLLADNVNSPNWPRSSLPVTNKVWLNITRMPSKRSRSAAGEFGAGKFTTEAAGKGLPLLLTTTLTRLINSVSPDGEPKLVTVPVTVTLSPTLTGVSVAGSKMKI